MWIVPFLLIGLAFAIKYGKMYNLIAGYNTMNPEEKERIHIEGIAHEMFRAFIVMGIVLLFGLLLSYILKSPEISLFLFFPTIILGVIYILVQSNSKKYRK